ncbi:MAG TPA: hypothetical protein VMV50_02485 [Candidatus Paceibacterota bacterium]|nr:hypothetical protein [Candidatus Paceibacterota bacterium]
MENDADEAWLAACEDRWMSASQVREAMERSSGRREIYPPEASNALERLEERGFVRSREDFSNVSRPGGRSTFVYRLTVSGQRRKAQLDARTSFSA